MAFDVTRALNFSLKMPLLLFVTTCETKNGLLLIAIFRKLFNPQNDGHLDSIMGGLSHMSGILRNLHFCQTVRPETMWDVK